MKHVFLGLLLMGSLSCAEATPPTPPEAKAITALLEAFVKSVDAQNTAEVAPFLHEQFRVVANQLMGQTEVSILDKTTYLSLLEGKKIGGDKRELTIHQLDIQGNNATVKATLEGEKLRFVTYFALVRDAQGQWFLVQDLPSVETK